MEDNTNQNINRWKKPLIYVLVCLAVLSIFFITYKKGYRLTDDLTLGKISTVSVNIPTSGTSIFVDDEKRIVTSKDDSDVLLKLSPRTHRIIVSTPGYLPWLKELKLKSGDTVSLFPIFVHVNQMGYIITNKDPEFNQIKLDIQKSAPPTKNDPIEKNGMKLWLEDNSVIVKKDDTETKVIQPDALIRNIAFYKDRTDVVMFSLNNYIYVIETNNTGLQNFLPVYVGQNPDFIPGPDDSIYVLDGQNLMQIAI